MMANMIQKVPIGLSIAVSITAILSRFMAVLNNKNINPSLYYI